jgi:hypothetical protein
MDNRSLDALIADHVMCAKANPPIPYSTDFQAAQQLVRLSEDAGFAVTFHPLPNGVEAHVGVGIGTAETREAALCLALLNLIARRRVTFFAQVSTNARRSFNANCFPPKSHDYDESCQVSCMSYDEAVEKNEAIRK